VWRFSTILTVAVLVIAGCWSGSVGDVAPKRNEGRDSSLAAARPGLGAEWRAYEVIDGFVPPPEAAKVAKGKFDRIHSGMTLRELTDVLGRGWMSQYEGCGIITWTCEDERQLQVWPTTSRPEEIIDAGPRQLGGMGGRGRMWMTRTREGGDLQDLPIPPK
jgi:hypothetical protein